MIYIQGNNRKQSIVFPKTLDQVNVQNNKMLYIALIVENIHIADFDFKANIGTSKRVQVKVIENKGFRTMITVTLS